MRELLDDRYRLGATLPASGVEIYREAWDQQQKRQVTVRLLVGDGDGDDGRSDVTSASSSGGPRPGAFAEAARAVVGVSGPRLADVHDCGEGLLEGDRARYLVVEPLAGRPLRECLGDGPPDLSVLLDWGRQLCEALDRMHLVGQVHADLSPDNVLVTKDGGVVLRAPSVARLAGHPVAGSAAEYASPELAAGTDGVDPRSDLYSLGCLLYFLVAGRPPFTGSPDEVLRAHQAGVAEPSWRHASRVPQRLDHLIRDLLEKDPQSRPADVREVARRLTEMAEGPLPRSVRPPGAPSSESPSSFADAPSDSDSDSGMRLLPGLPDGAEAAQPALAAVVTGLALGAATAGALTAFTALSPLATAGVTVCVLVFWPLLARTVMNIQRGRDIGAQSVGCGMLLVLAGVCAASFVWLPWPWWAAAPVGLLLACGAAVASLLAFSVLVGGAQSLFQRYGYPWGVSSHAAAAVAVIGGATCAAAGAGPYFSWGIAVVWGLGTWIASAMVLGVLLVGYRGSRPGR
ncbi:serine/threonine-protein kinase [Streptomyces sp. NPDC047706]|uniref:serine/threonine-protein kinase n=1 Tax=Streptomyces sp. NPDC047706 TaxID=3365486 RepID=UPI00371EB372